MYSEAAVVCLQARQRHCTSSVVCCNPAVARPQFWDWTLQLRCPPSEPHLVGKESFLAGKLCSTLSASVSHHLLSRFKTPGCLNVWLTFSRFDSTDEHAPDMCLNMINALNVWQVSPHSIMACPGVCLHSHRVAFDTTGIGTYCTS